MDEWVFAESKPRVSQLALWAYRIATWPLAVGVIGAILLGLVGLADNQYGDGDLSGIVLAPVLLLLFTYAFALAPLAMILGVAGLSQIGRKPRELYGREFAQVAVIVGAVVSICVVLMLTEGWLMR